MVTNDRADVGVRHTDVTRAAKDPNHVVERTSVLDDWQTSVSRSFVPLAVMASPDSQFHARLEGRICDGVLFSSISATAHTVNRTTDHIQESTSEYLKLTLLESGSAILVQDGREAVIEPGDTVIYDTSRPYSLEFTTNMSALVVMFPHSIIGIDRRILSTLTAVRLVKGSFAGAVGQFLRGLPSALEALDSATATRLTHNAVDLIQTMVGYELSEANRDPTAELMLRIDEYINAHLGVHGLNPDMVAAATFISTRHLHALFQRRDTTVSRLIRDRQLEHARRDLIDPMRMGETIGSIASSWGFPDAAQFSKSFRAFAGMTPRDYRATALRPARSATLT